MENTKITNKNVWCSNNLDESGIRDMENEGWSALIYRNGLEPPILGTSYREPDIPEKYIEPTVLDTSLPYIPVYVHLKTYDLKPIVRPSTPPVLTELRLKYLCRDDNTDNESCKSSRAASSTGRGSKGRSSITIKPRESERSFEMEQLTYNSSLL